MNARGSSNLQIDTSKASALSCGLVRQVALPGCGSLRAAFAPWTKPCVYPRIRFDQPTEEPDYIGQAIEVGQDFRLDDAAILHQANRCTFGAAADCARHLVSSGFAVRSGQGPVTENSFHPFDLVHEAG